MSAIVFQGVGKRYRTGWRSRWVLRGLDLEVCPGEVVGLIGANGAGKTTLFKLLAGFTSPNAGRIELLGRDPRRPEARKRLAYLPERPSFPQHLTGPQVLRYLAAAESIPRALAADRATRLIELVALGHHAHLRVGDYSKGMVQRLAMAQCFLGQPEVALLDEPMSGLDPPGRQLVADLVWELKRSGATVLFSSHLLADLEKCCTHLAVLREGRVTKMPLASLPEAAGMLEEYFARCAGY